MAEKQKMVAVLMSEHMCEKVMNALGEQPYREVGGVVAELHAQFQDQKGVLKTIAESSPKEEFVPGEQ